MAKQKITKPLAKAYHYDLYGKREYKYKFLAENSVKDINWTQLDPQSPQHYFVPKDFGLESEYNDFYAINKLFSLNVTGIVTMGDSFAIDDTLAGLQSKINDFLDTDYTDLELQTKYKLGKNYAKWIISNKNVHKIINQNYVKLAYRPFDDRYTYFDNKVIWRWRKEVMQHFLHGENVGLSFHKREELKSPFAHIFVTRFMSEHGYTSGKTTNSQAPLYLYQSQLGTHELEKVPNLNMEMIREISEKLKLEFIPDDKKDNSSDNNTFNPLDILDYIYAILHSPTYRERYKEFLKIDFPRIPFTSDQKLFWSFVEKGREIRQYHLMEHANSSSLITQYPVAGENEVITPKYSENKVWINDVQYFDNVSQIAWEFYIGGYQPAQKWLKDRKGRKLSFDEVLHYQKIIVALVNTDRVMKDIDGLVKEWPMK